MVTIKELLEAGKLQEAITAATQAVKARPADSSLRTSLVVLLCFAGDFARAARQLDVIGDQGAEAEISAQVYRNLLKAERARQGFFAGGEPPSFTAEPPDYVALHLSAVKQLSAGAMAEAVALLDRAVEAHPALPGKLNDQPFRDFRDADDFTAPVIEMLLGDQYVWLPFAQLRRLEITPPRYWGDLLWLRARFETASGLVGEGHLPALYAASSAHADEAVKLGRKTVWQEVGDGLFIAAGRHIWLADEREIEPPAVRTLEFAIDELTE